ncbi:MAG: zinc ribbon domain-containing protein [Candidatus Heimdallarchaeaceae archaeon]
MAQVYQINPFEYAKQKISTSAENLRKYLLVSVIISFISFAIAIIVIFAILIPLGFSLSNLEPEKMYAFMGNVFAGGILAIILMLLAVIALLVIFIIVYVQYFKLANGYKILADADPASTSAKNASYGIYGYVIAIILAIFVPGIAGSIISILGNASLALGFYFIFKTFEDYRLQNRFPKPPSKILFVGVLVNFISAIINIFSFYSSLGTIAGFILLLIGFGELSKDILLLQPPGAQTGTYQEVPQKVKSEAKAVVQTPQVPETGSKFCERCGAKNEANAKFCVNCGASL